MGCEFSAAAGGAPNEYCRITAKSADKCPLWTVAKTAVTSPFVPRNQPNALGRTNITQGYRVDCSNSHLKQNTVRRLARGTLHG